MRALFASTQGAGHFNPLVPFIDAALRQGHEVLVAGPSASRRHEPGLVRRGCAAGRARDGGAPADRQRVRRTCSGGRVSTARRAATIGVYDWTLEAWLDALRATRVAQVLDVRQRRGVRGSRYAWANSARLQAALAEAGIEYRHHEELAPTTELRQLQYTEDDRVGVGKRSRVELAAEYRRGYIREILDQVDLRPIVEAMPADGAAALMCVEADPEACHRSLIAERLEAEFRLSVEHLRPSPL